MKAHGRKGIQMTEARRPINADRAGLHRFTAGAALACATAFLLATAPAAQAGEGKAGGRDAVRVCQDPNNLPFANDKEQGFENRIAELLGKHLGVPVTYFNYPQRFVFIRNTLRYKLPGEDYPCDIVMGVPVGFDQVSVTKPYYRSTYALVYAQGRGLDAVKSVDDFLALPSEQLKKPYALLTVNVFAADTDAEARRLFTSMQVQFINLIRGVPGRVQPPIDDIESYWRPDEKEWVARALARSFVGTAATIEPQLRDFISTYRPDELMISGHFFDTAARLNSVRIAAEVREQMRER